MNTPLSQDWTCRPLYCIQKNIRGQWAPVFTFNSNIYHYFNGTATVSSNSPINNSSNRPSSNIKAYLLYTLWPKDEAFIKTLSTPNPPSKQNDSIQSLKYELNVASSHVEIQYNHCSNHYNVQVAPLPDRNGDPQTELNLKDLNLAISGNQRCHNTDPSNKDIYHFNGLNAQNDTNDQLDLSGQNGRAPIWIVPIWQVQEVDTKKCSFYTIQIPVSKFSGGFTIEFLGFVPQVFGKVSLLSSTNGDQFKLVQFDNLPIPQGWSERQTVLLGSFWFDSKHCIKFLETYYVTTQTLEEETSNTEKQNVFQQSTLTLTSSPSSDEVKSITPISESSLSSSVSPSHSLQDSDALTQHKLEVKHTLSPSIDKETSILEQISKLTIEEACKENQEGNDVSENILNAPDRTEMEEHLNSIQNSEAKIAVIETHLNELLSLTRRECNKMEFFKLEGMKILLTLLQTQWEVQTERILLPVFSIISNLALAVDQNQGSIYSKLLEQEGVMEQCWLLLKINMNNKVLVRSCLITLNNISFQVGIMPFFSKHAQEICILLSLLDKFQKDMRISLLCFQASAAAAKYSFSANDSTFFTYIESYMTKIFEIMHLYEYNQRLILSGLEIIDCQIRRGYEGVDSQVLRVLLTKCIKNFKRDSLVLTAILEILINLNTHPNDILGDEVSQLLQEYSFSLSKDESDKHSISKKLYESVFPNK